MIIWYMTSSSFFAVATVAFFEHFSSFFLSLERGQSRVLAIHAVHMHRLGEHITQAGVALLGHPADVSRSSRRTAAPPVPVRRTMPERPAI